MKIFLKDIKTGLLIKASGDRKSIRLNSSHSQISYAVFCLKKKKSARRRAARVRHPRHHRSFLHPPHRDHRQRSRVVAAGVAVLPMGELELQTQRAGAAAAAPVRSITRRNRHHSADRLFPSRPDRVGDSSRIPVDVTQLEVKIYGSSVRFPVRLQPKSSKNEIGAVQNGALKVRVTAPPVEGAANEALVKLLAESLDVPRR